MNNLEFIKRLLEDEIQNDDLIATMNMIDNIYYDEEAVYVDVPYASYVEYGINPNYRVPVGRLVTWAMAKFGVDKREAFRIAYAVKKKIAMFGIGGRFFVEKALDEYFDVRMIRRDDNYVVYEAIPKRGD